MEGVTNSNSHRSQARKHKWGVRKTKLEIELNSVFTEHNINTYNAGDYVLNFKKVPKFYYFIS